MELNMNKKWLEISKTISQCKKWKIWQILRLQAVNLAPKMDRRRSAWHLARSSSSVVRTLKFFPPAESWLVSSNFPRVSRMQDGTETASLGMRADPWYGAIFLFLEQIAPSWRHISALIHALVVGSRVDVVTLCDKMVRVATFSCRFFRAMARNKAEKKNQSSSMYFCALI